MSYVRSKIVSITLPQDLLAKIDGLAYRDYASRSDIIRQATLKYIREVQPGDTQLLEFLDDYDNNRL